MSRRYRRGQRPRADDVNKFFASTRRGTRGGPGVSASDGTGGRGLHLTGSGPFWAEITGPAAGGRYPFRQVCGEPPAPCGKSGSDAIEVAGATVDTGTFVRMYPTAFDHRFGSPCKTCKPCNRTTGIAFVLIGCPSAGVGAGFSVTLDRITPNPVDGLETLTTDAAGCVRFDLDRTGFGPGTYRARVAARDRFAAVTTQGYVVNCGNAFACTAGVGITLPPAEAYACFCSCGPRPWAKTLYLTNKWGTAALTWTGGATPAWVGTQVITTRAATKWWWIPGDTYNPHCWTDDVADGQSVTVEWTLGFGGGCFLGVSFVRAQTCIRHPDYPTFPLSCSPSWSGNPADGVGIMLPIADDATYLPIYGACTGFCEQYYLIRAGGQVASGPDCNTFTGSGTIIWETDSTPFAFNE